MRAVVDASLPPDEKRFAIQGSDARGAAVSRLSLRTIAIVLTQPVRSRLLTLIKAASARRWLMQFGQ